MNKFISTYCRPMRNCSLQGALYGKYTRAPTFENFWELSGIYIYIYMNMYIYIRIFCMRYVYTPSPTRARTHTHAHTPAFPYVFWSWLFFIYIFLGQWRPLPHPLLLRVLELPLNRRRGDFLRRNGWIHRQSGAYFWVCVCVCVCACVRVRLLGSLSHSLAHSVENTFYIEHIL